MKTYGSPMPLIMFIFLAAGIIYALSFSGCNNTVTSTETKTNRALSEQNFVSNRGLKAAPNTTILVNLEDVHSPANDSIPDTGPIGEDIIPFRYTENGIYKIQLENGARCGIYLTDIVVNSWIFNVYPESNSASVYIPAGDYNLHIISGIDYSSDSAIGRQTLFIKSVPGDPFKTVVSVSDCSNCDLSFTSLDYMYFSGMNLAGSNLSNASLGHTSLVGTNFVHTNLNNTYFYMSNMIYADLSHSSLQGVMLRNTDLKHANLSSSDLTNANLRFADASFANFCGSNLTGVIYDGIFTNGETQCWP